MEASSGACSEPLFDMPVEPLDVEAGMPCVVSPISVKHLSS